MERTVPAYACNKDNKQLSPQRGPRWTYKGEMGREGAGPRDLEFCLELRSQVRPEGLLILVRAASIMSQSIDDVWHKGADVGRARSFGAARPRGRVPALKPHQNGPL
jgi:hypothetical protein